VTVCADVVNRRDENIDIVTDEKKAPVQLFFSCSELCNRSANNRVIGKNKEKYERKTT
jgi:hypothetical protein